MLKKIKNLLIVALIVSSAALLAQDLSSNDDSIVINNLKQIASDKNTEKLPEVLALLDADKSEAVHAQTIITIGKLKQKGTSTLKLRDFIKKTDNSNLAYMVIAAIINLQDIEQKAAAKNALSLAEQKWPDDKILQHACKKSREKLAAFGE